MRKAPSLLMLSVAVPALSALPVLTPPTPEPEPVAPEVRAVALAGVDPAALRGAAGEQSKEASAEAREDVLDSSERGREPGRPEVLTKARGTADFELLGVTWRAGTAGELTVVVRTHGEDGWTDWTSLDPAPTPERSEGALRRAGTEPLYAGPSDGYQVRIDVRSGRLPEDVRVDLIDPGESDADSAVGTRAPLSTAAAAASRPRIYSRAEWGADESLRGSSPNYSSTIKAGFVHHTAGTNGYAAAEVPKILRGIYAYHTRSNGWSDVGYNFLVDRFGRIWEGRYGGVDRPVTGAHTGGFNTDTFGVSAIGNFDKVSAPAAMTDAIAKVLAWKLSLHYRNPLGTTTLTSSGGGTSRYAAGRKVTVNVISAHRNMGYTSCPGKNLYAKMSTIKSRASTFMGAGLVAPAATPGSRPHGGEPITVAATVLSAQTWRLDVRRSCDGVLVRRLSGTAQPGAPVAAKWDLRDSAGAEVRPGGYQLALTSSSSTSTARPWTGAVTVTSPSTTPSAKTAVAAPGPGTYVAVKPARLYDSRTRGKLPLGAGGRVDVKVAGVGGVPSTGVGSVALNVTAACSSTTTSVAVWPAGSPRPTVAALNVQANTTRSAFTVAPVGGNGMVSIRNAAGSADVMVDVVGYYPVPTTTASAYHATPAFRLYDSRRDSAGAVTKGEPRTLRAPVIDGVAPSRMSGLLVNVISLSSTGAGALTVYPAGAALPSAPSVSFTRGVATANRAVARLSNGRFTVATTAPSSHVVIDVVGWYSADSELDGATFEALPTTAVLDTRSGVGAPKAPVAARGVVRLTVTGTGKPVPADASAVVMTLTSTAATRGTYLTAWPTGSLRPPTSDLNVLTGQTSSNLVVVPIGSRGRVDIYNAAGTSHLVGAVLGYYR